jgi:predicted alpha/beta-fold hydrolase
MVTSRSPSQSFRPAWWIPGAHAQTLWGKLCRRTCLPHAGYFERWDTPDGDFLDIYRVPAAVGAPRLLVLHGLEGTIRSHYARGILQRAATRGWAADLLIFRGCGSEMNRAPRFYHSGETGDLAFVAERIAQQHPRDPMFVVGYSLGGNVLLKWLGEGIAPLPVQLRGAAAVSVPYDLQAGAQFISQGFSRNYERHFLRTLKSKAIAKLERFPGLLDPAPVQSAQTIVDFDEAFTAPIHGFASATDYYRRSSAIGFLDGIQVPTLLLSAFDDPFLPPESLHQTGVVASGNSSLLPCFSPHGGHVGFVSGDVPGRPVYYSEDRILAFFGRQLAT